MLLLVGNQVPMFISFNISVWAIFSTNHVHLLRNSFFTSFFNKLSFRVNKSVYIA